MNVMWKMIADRLIGNDFATARALQMKFNRSNRRKMAEYFWAYASWANLPYVMGLTS